MNFHSFSFLIHPTKTKMRKDFDITFRVKRSLPNICTVFETMDSVFGLGSEIEVLKNKSTKNQSENYIYFGQKNEGVILDDGNFDTG